MADQVADATHPSAAAAKAYSAEKNTAIVRFAVIAFNVASYWLWLYPGGLPWLAGIISVVALVYGVYDLVGQPYRHFPAMQTAAWTAITDGALIALWIEASGAYASPYYLLWYLSLVAVTFRYSWKGTLIAAGAYAGAYAALMLFDPRTVWPQMAVRIAYIILVGALGSLLARESTRVFQERYHLGVQAQEASRLRALAEATPDALLVARGGIILEANRAFCDLVGRSRDDVLGESAVAFAAPQSAEAVKERALNPQDDPMDVWAQTSKGLRLLRVQARAIDWEGGPARIVAMRDVTEERAAEESRMQAREAEMEVGRLREMDRFKTDFINAAAHELNTPITPIKLQLHMLKRRVAAAAPERESVDILDRNMDRLAALVEEMLDVARLESGRLLLDPHPADLAAVVADAAATFRPAAADKGIRLEVHAGGPMQANIDAKRVSQVLYNLLSNALKFTPRGGTIDVTESAADGHVEVAVKDSGIGLSKEEMAKLFHPFVQLHRERITAPGTGLGLYISRGIAQRHGGTLVVDSEGPMRGATFIVRLPIEGPAPAGSAAA